MGGSPENHVDEEARHGSEVDSPVAQHRAGSVTGERDDGQIAIEPPIARTAAVTTTETPIFDEADEASF